jgi:hypothetical protein
LAIGTAIGTVFGGHALDNIHFKMTFLLFTLITSAFSFLFLGIQLYVVCTEGRSVSDIGSEISSRESTQFGDDEEDDQLGSGYDVKW